MVDTNDCEYTITLIFAFAEVIAEDMPDKVRSLCFDGLKCLQSFLAFYKQRGYMEELLNGIAEKKCRMILSVTSKTEMEKVLKPHCPHYDGVRFVPDAYNVPEEELICWSETSLLSPLNEAGCKRYMRFSKAYFPSKASSSLGVTDMLKPQDFRQTGFFVIDNKRYNIQKLTCEQLRIHYGTGRSYHVSGTGRDKKYGYRVGCMTDIGDILETDWIALARCIIERDSEQDLYEGLLEYSKTCAWLRSKAEHEVYARQLHMSRIFDNVKRVWYQ